MRISSPTIITALRISGGYDTVDGDDEPQEWGGYEYEGFERHEEEGGR